MQGYLAQEMLHYRQLELERQAQEERLVNLAIRARLRKRKAARAARALRLASDAVGATSGRSSESRAAVRTAR